MLEMVIAILKIDEITLQEAIKKNQNLKKDDFIVLLTPLLRLNLYSSVKDYIEIFSLNPNLANIIIGHLYSRENYVSQINAAGITFEGANGLLELTSHTKNFIILERDRLKSLSMWKFWGKI
jgi:hypothetical protein